MKALVWRRLPGRLWALIVGLLWLVVISVLHLWLNSERQSSNTVPMGYMPVITNLAAPLVDFASQNSTVRFQAIKFSSFAEMGGAFKSGYIQAAFIIAPLAIVLHQQRVPLKVVYIGNRHESTLVVNKDAPYRHLSEMAGRTIAVPIRYSGHYLALKRYLRTHGLPPDYFRTVEVSPGDMPSALATGGIDGYFVGEPFASKGLQSGTARRLMDVEEIWPKFICNLLIVREEWMRSHPEQVQALVEAAVRSCLYAREHLAEVEEIACRYWGQQPEVVSLAFSNPPGRIRFDLYVPVLEELEEMVREMKEAGLIEGPVDLRGVVEPKFAEAASTNLPSSLQDLMKK